MGKRSRRDLDYPRRAQQVPRDVDESEEFLTRQTTDRQESTRSFQNFKHQRRHGQRAYDYIIHGQSTNKKTILMTEQQEILNDIDIVIAVLEVRDNTYCINKLKAIKEKLKEQWKQ
jgi:activator of 2-hydroxyglutaryl-CoA dehydratase